MTKKVKLSDNKIFIFGLLAALFILPFLLAVNIYRTRQFIPETLNYGHLLSSPKSLQRLALYDYKNNRFDQNTLRGEWLLVYLDPHQCAKLCQHNLYLMRQIRLALGKNQNRLQRIWLTFRHNSNLASSGSISAKYPGMLHLQVNQADWQKLAISKVKSNQGHFYLVDPLGNIMMDYATKLAPKGIFKDLKRLLYV
ncbi:MAG: SCO family protein [Pseudomonadota bacterium]